MRAISYRLILFVFQPIVAAVGWFLLMWPSPEFPDLAGRSEVYSQMVQQETTTVAFVVVVSGFLAALVHGVVFSSDHWLTSGPMTDRILSVLLIAGVSLTLQVLWAAPIRAFHHDTLVGLCGWFGVGGEDGFSCRPTLVSPVTALLTYGLLHRSRSMVYRERPVSI